MFTEGRLLLERVARRARPRTTGTPPRSCDGAVDAAADTERPVGGPARGAAGPRARPRCCSRHPLRELVTVEGPYPAYADRPRALFGSWYEFFPRSEGATKDAADRQGHQRQLPHRRQAPRRRRRDGLRRDLPAADPPDRRGQPQGPEQHPDPGPRRHRLAVGDRVARTAGTTRSTPTSARSRTSTRSSPGPASSASRWRWTWRSRPRPTTRG